jgi:hypothetical protein
MSSTPGTAYHTFLTVDAANQAIQAAASLSQAAIGPILHQPIHFP